MSTNIITLRKLPGLNVINQLCFSIREPGELFFSLQYKKLSPLRYLVDLRQSSVTFQYFGQRFNQTLRSYGSVLFILMTVSRYTIEAGDLEIFIRYYNKCGLMLSQAM